MIFINLNDFFLLNQFANVQKKAFNGYIYYRFLKLFVLVLYSCKKIY